MRHLSRHLQATVQDHVRKHLVELGWIGLVVDVPFGALPVIFQTVAPRESDLVAITPNLVAVSFGSQRDDSEEQLGGGLVSQEHAFFVDVMAENEGVGLALAEDVRDLLVGRATYVGRSASRFLQLENQETQPPTPVVGYTGEFTEVMRSPADRDLGTINWQVISGTVFLHLPGEA